MYAHPFSADYWRDASREVRDLRKLLFSALMIALCIVLAQVPSVPLFGGAKVTWGFLARSVCAWVCGPVLGLLFAFAEDILSFFLTGGGGAERGVYRGHQPTAEAAGVPGRRQGPPADELFVR